MPADNHFILAKKPEIDPEELAKRLYREKRRRYDREGYRRRRKELVAKLGGRCVCCGYVPPEGERKNTEELQFDHIYPVDKEHDWHAMRRKNRWSRLAYYRRMAEAGRIQLLCFKCNSGKQDRGECECGRAA